MSPTLEQLLPDDVLLRVMRYLSVDDVFACRLVCKRLEGLARHPNVWRHRRIAWKHCLCPVLRLAPCLEALECKERGCNSSFTALESTKCAVSSLSLDFLVIFDESLVSADWLENFTQAVRNQGALGQLKHVTVHTPRSVRLQDHNKVKLEGADALCNVLAQCPGLLSVRFLLCFPAVNSPLEGGPPASSLVVFECPLTSYSDSFVKTMLAGHAATLEVVNIFITYNFNCNHPWEESYWAELTELLASMPRLRSLKCASLPRLEALAASNTLKDVDLTECSPIFRHHRNHNSQITNFLRGAKELRALSVHAMHAYSNFDYVGMLDAVLDSSERSLEHLSLADFSDVQPLVEALPRLPALRQLDLLEVEDLGRLDRLLLGITPLTAPNLRRLEVDPSDWEPCGHDWLHSDPVRAVFAANPTLHIHLRKVSACLAYEDYSCEACASVCHLEAGWHFPGRLVLFAHEPGKCPAPEDHTADSKWRSVHMPCTSA